MSYHATGFMNNKGYIFLNTNQKKSENQEDFIDISICNTSNLEVSYSDIFLQAVKDFGHEIFFRQPVIQFESTIHHNCSLLLLSNVEPCSAFALSYKPLGFSTFIAVKNYNWAISVYNYCMSKNYNYIMTFLQSSYDIYEDYLNTQLQHKEQS